MINLYSIRPKGFNVGNDVIYVALKGFLERAFGSEYLNIISLPATNKYESSKKAGFTKGVIYEVNQFGHGVILGGGNLYENGEIDIDPIALKALDKPFMICSVSRGRIYNKQNQLVDRTDVIGDASLKMLNEKATYSLSRDEATRDYIEGLGVENEVGACPTLFLNEFIGEKNISKQYETDCLISIRTPNLMSVPPEKQYELREILKQSIVDLKSRGYHNVKILCHDHRDIPFADSFSEVDYIFTDDASKFLDILRSTRLNITFRLHSFLPCLSLGIPAINIGYDERALSLTESIGMGDWNIHYINDDVNAELRNRMDNLGELEKIKDANRDTRWAEIRENFIKNFAAFAEDVKKVRD